MADGFDGRVGLNLTSITGDYADQLSFNQDIYQRIAMARGMYSFFGKEGIISGGASVVGDLTTGTKYPAVSLLILDDSNEVWFFETTIDSNIDFTGVSGTSVKLYAKIVLDTDHTPNPAKGSRTDISFILLDSADSAPIHSILLGTGTTNVGLTAITAYTPESIFIPSIADLDVGGSDTQVQFNDGGIFGGDADLTFNKGTNKLSATNLGVSGTTTLNSGLTGIAKLTAGVVSAGSIDISSETNLATSYPATLTGDTIGVGYNTTNLKLTTNQLNTIQDITTSSNVQFGSITSNQFSNFVDTQRYGFLNQTQTSISFDGTSVFTLTDAGSGWSYYRTGIKYTISGNKTIDLLNVENPLIDGRMYYIYIDSTNGSLSASITPWTLNDTLVPVATIKWNNTLTPKYWLADERHSCLIDRREHYLHHYTDGTKSISVGALAGATINSDVDADKTFSIASSVIADEDLIQTLATLSDPNGTATDYVVAYRTGASSWAWKASAMPFVYNVGNTNNTIQYDNGTGMTDCGTGVGANTRWVNSYLMMTNIQGAARYLFVMGDAQYTTLAGAQAEDPSNLSFTGFPVIEGVITHRITWTTYTSTSKGKCMMAVLPVNISGTSLNGTGGSNTIDHNQLQNLAVGDVHTQYALLAGRAGGQTLIGGSGASENLTLQSTSNATRGSIILNCCPAIFDATTAAKGIQFGDGASGYDTQIYRNGANQLRTPDGLIVDLNSFIGDTSNAKATLGLTINQGAADDEILALKSSDVAQSFTDMTEADTYGLFKKGSAAGGGLSMQGFGEANTTGLILAGYISSTDPTDTIPSIQIIGNKLTGATNAPLGDAETVLDLMNNTNTIFRLRGDGGLWHGTNYSTITTFGTYNQKYEYTGGNLLVWDAASLGAEIHTNNTATADPNGTEANATTGWTGVAATLSATAADKYAGTYSMLITGTSTSGRAEYDFTTVAGKMYKISIWAKRGAQGTTQRFTAWTGFLGLSSSIGITASWAEYVFYVTATGTTGKIRAYCNSGGSIGDEMYVDNVSIKEIIGGNISCTGKLTGSGGTTGLKIDSAGNTTADGNLTMTGRFFTRQTNDAGPMTATGGTAGEIVYNTANSKWYGCTVTHATAATWSALN